MSVEAVQARLICVLLEAVAVKFEGALGGVVSAVVVPIGVFMSLWISLGLRARL